MKKGAIAFIILFFVAAPLLASAATPNIWSPNILKGPLISCTGAGAAGGTDSKNCESLCDLVSTIINIVYFFMGVVLWLAAPILLLTSGVMFLIAGANPEMISKAKKTLTGTAIGIAIVLCSWLIVNTFVTFLGIKGVGGFGTNTCTVAPAGTTSFNFIPTAYAAGTITINPNIPGTNSITQGGNPGVLIANFYQFALLIAGILALGAMVYGGVRYTFSAGNPSGQSDAKEWIWGAFYGLLLLGGAYIILNTINPNLLNLTIPSLSAVSSAAGTGGGGAGNTGQCPATALTPITDPQALAMENGQTVIWASSDPNVQKNLTALQAAVNKMQSLYPASFKGTMTVTSAYRPNAYQAHLYEIYQDSQKFASGISGGYNVAGDAACQTIYSALQAEQNKHGICKGNTGSPCLVAAPSGCSDHPTGKGVDISMSSGTYSTINTFLTTNNIPLQWAALSGDPVHFRLTNPPYSGCASGS